MFICHLLKLIQSYECRHNPGNLQDKTFLNAPTFARYQALLDTSVNPLKYNVPKWSDTLYKSGNKCCKIFKVQLTILGLYALKRLRLFLCGYFWNFSIKIKENNKILHLHFSFSSFIKFTYVYKKRTHSVRILKLLYQSSKP